MPISLARKKASPRFVSSHAWFGWNGSWQHLPKMGSMEKQFEGLGVNLHKKRHQARGLWNNQRSITPSLIRCIRRRLYAQSAYLRLVNVSGKIHCCLLIGKSRITPKKYVTIPRLELVAAVLSVKISARIRRKLDIEWKNETFG